jgi:F420H(2)-dependent quinone reductase
MKAIKIAVIALLVYAGIVTAFESLIGYFQPSQPGSTILLTTFDADGKPHDRVVSKLETDGKTYVAANHWPRAWYRRALENPKVQVTVDGQKVEYRAVPVTGAEHDRVQSDHPHGFVFLFLTGFPPRYFVRLDPAEGAVAPEGAIAP